MARGSFWRLSASGKQLNTKKKGASPGKNAKHEKEERGAVLVEREETRPKLNTCL